MEQDKVLLETIVKAIVDEPDAVRVERSVDDLGVLLTLEVAPGDMGKIIGVAGRTANALRQILRVLGKKNMGTVSVKILEPEGQPR